MQAVIDAKDDDIETADLAAADALTIAGRPRILACLLAAALTLVALSVHSSQAQSRRVAVAEPAQSIADRINSNTLAIVSGNINAAWLTIAYDLSAVLDDGDNLRILPVIGKGGAQNVRDVRYLKGVDLGITVTSVLGHFRHSGEIPDIDDKIVYITKLFDDDMHLIVHASSGISSIEQLRDKKVNFSDVGSATQVSSRDVFERLGIPVQEVNMGQQDAYEKMRSGEIAATIQFGAKPAPAILKLTTAAGFRLLPVSFSKPLQEDFLPSRLSSEDYPGLIAAGQGIDTIAYGALIIAYNWPKGSERYRRIEKFVDAFFAKLPELQKPPRHPKWTEVNLATVLPGIRRFEGAEEWIQRAHEQQGIVADPQVATHDRFEQFMSARGISSGDGGNTPDHDRLFHDFIKWQQSHDRR
jgi:uncharacterized protein